MQIFKDLNGIEYPVTFCDGVEEKINIDTGKAEGYVATSEGNPVCDISKKVYEKLKNIYEQA